MVIICFKLKNKRQRNTLLEFISLEEADHIELNEYMMRESVKAQNKIKINKGSVTSSQEDLGNSYFNTKLSLMIVSTVIFGVGYNTFIMVNPLFSIVQVCSKWYLIAYGVTCGLILISIIISGHLWSIENNKLSTKYGTIENDPNALFQFLLVLISVTCGIIMAASGTIGGITILAPLLRLKLKPLAVMATIIFCIFVISIPFSVSSILTNYWNLQVYYILFFGLLSVVGSFLGICLAQFCMKRQSDINNKTVCVFMIISKVLMILALGTSIYFGITYDSQLFNNRFMNSLNYCN